MIDIFTIPSTDRSVSYLGALFGHMYGVIPGGSDQAEVGLLGTMFSVFNSTVLTVGAFIIVYTTVVGVIMTAHEGEFMGKKWNNIWIPLRMVMGIATLVPTGSGYSVLQIIFMWIIVQGIGAADMLWTTVLGYVNLTGSPYASVTIPSVDATQSMGQLFQEITCHVSSQKNYENPYPNQGNLGGYYCSGMAQSVTSFCRTGGLPTGIPTGDGNVRYSFGPDGACGTLFSCNAALACGGDQSQLPNKLQCIACTAQTSALASIMPVFQQVANAFVDQDYAYTKYFASSVVNPLNPQRPPAPPDFVQKYCTDNGLANCTAGGGLPAPGLGESAAPAQTINTLLWPSLASTLGQGNFLSTSIDFYLGQISRAVNEYIATQTQNPTGLTGVIEEARQNGWIFAGAYYYYLAQKGGGTTATSSMPSIKADAGNPQATPSSKVYNYRNNFTAARTILSAASGGGAGGWSSSAVDLGGPSDSGDAALSSSNNVFANLTGSNQRTNPLSKLVNAGKALLGTASALFATLLISTILIGIFSCLSVLVVGSGLPANPACGATGIVYFFLVPYFLAFLSALISIGGLLAVYVPLVPYMIFTFGAIAWLIMTIETMVAGPLVALGILSPSGQHEIMGKAEPGIMLIFYAFLRPSLMIFGLVAAMLLAYVVQAMIDTMFWGVAFNIQGCDTVQMNQSFGSTGCGKQEPISSILFMVAYTFFVIAALNKCFAAIHLIPQHVMGWIGGSHAARDMGEMGGVEEAKGGFQRGAGAAGGAIAFNQVAGKSVGLEGQGWRKNKATPKGPTGDKEE